MEPYEGTQKVRFVVKKEELLTRIGMSRRTAQFLQADTTLNKEWWSMPFKGDVSKAGQHLPNRIMALATMLKDLLLMGDEQVDHLIPGEIRFAQYLAPELRTREEAAAMYFFMLSHFVADAHMPCHCDGRNLAGYDEGLHNELEMYWSRKVGTDFERKFLLGEDSVSNILEVARDVDAKFSLSFENETIPDLYKKHDVWLEAVYLCRATFAMASIVAPCSKYPYGGNQRAPFSSLFVDDNKQLLDEMSTAVMHDAVLSTAIIWKHLWNKVSRLDA